MLGSTDLTWLRPAAGTSAVFRDNRRYETTRAIPDVDWDICSPTTEVEVIEDDMRVWMPDEKADIIATELLWSFSDNKLSPECIGGVWRFSTPQTISILQSYSSYLAPISSFRMRQELQKTSLIAYNQEIFDKIQVVRLRNYYLIDDPKRLFSYQHERIALELMAKEWT